MVDPMSPRLASISTSAPAGPLFSDAVTVSPYLGFGSLRPALDAARAAGAGVFVLALTSNPEGTEVQHAVRPDGSTVAATVLKSLKAENAAEAAEGRLGSYGAVVGATLGRAPQEACVELTIDGPLLAPGIGAQGATPADLPAVFGPAIKNVVPSVSRGVLRHGPDAASLVAAASRMAEEVRAVAE